MQYSFEILNRPIGLTGSSKGHKILHCKVDCTNAELAFIKANGLYNMLIYEYDRNKHPSSVIAKGIYTFVFSSADPAKNKKTKEALGQRYIEQLTLHSFLQGVKMEMPAYDIPLAEDMIEARLIEIGENMKRTFEHLSVRGRTSDV